MSNLKKPNWERDVVYLVQFPRTKFCPSISPFALKMETWLRIADIKYENVNNNMKNMSKKGQIPFIELNGEEMDDSSFIINSLSEIFHKNLESHLSPAEGATARAFEHLLEQSLLYSLMRMRSEKMNELMMNPLMENTGIPAPMKVAKPVLSWKFGKTLKTKLFNQGNGRHSKEEAFGIFKKDMKALSDYLGKKRYMTGDQPTQLDAGAFGLLCQFWFLPTGSETEYRKFMASDTQNLVEYVDNMKYKYWPDWDTACRELRLDTDWKDPDTNAQIQNAAAAE